MLKPQELLETPVGPFSATKLEDGEVLGQVVGQFNAVSATLEAVFAKYPYIKDNLEKKFPSGYEFVLVNGFEIGLQGFTGNRGYFDSPGEQLQAATNPEGMNLREVPMPHYKAIICRPLPAPLEGNLPKAPL